LQTLFASEERIVKLYMTKQGDVKRKRRLIGSQAKIRWYARYRTMRFAKSDFQPHHGKKSS
jgi:hypothetical protein